MYMPLSLQSNEGQTTHSSAVESLTFLAEWWSGEETLITSSMKSLCSNKPSCSMVKLTSVDLNGTVFSALHFMDVA